MPANKGRVSVQADAAVKSAGLVFSFTAPLLHHMAAADWCRGVGMGVTYQLSTSSCCENYINASGFAMGSGTYSVLLVSAAQQNTAYHRKQNGREADLCRNSAMSDCIRFVGLSMRQHFIQEACLHAAGIQCHWRYRGMGSVWAGAP